MATQQLRIEDPRLPPKPHGRLDAFLLRPLRDPRDLVFLRIAATCTAFVATGAIVLYAVPPKALLALGPIYLFVLFTRLTDRFSVMLHAIAHRPTFRPGYEWLASAIRWSLSPFFGLSPHLYFTLHVGMHHVENNGAGDLTSTAGYRRDHIVDFARYALRFLFLGPFQLTRYLRAHGRERLARGLVIGTAAHLAGLALLFVLSPAATLVVFGIPALLMPAALMAGNWAQHALIDPDDPTNPWRNSITLVNSRHNRRCYNDGYHLHHHLRPGLHWSEIPAAFEQALERYAAEDAVVLDGLDGYRDVWLDLMLHRYERMARHVVALGESPRSLEETAAWLQRRARPAA